MYKQNKRLIKYIFSMSFASNLHDVLEFRDVQVKELSAKTGISKNTLDNYLSGQKSLPNIENGVKIAQALGVTVEYLVTGVSKTADSSRPAPATAVPRTAHKELIEAISSLDAIDIASLYALVASMQKRYK